MQPVHLLTDMNWAADRLGPDRARYSYAWRSMLNHGVHAGLRHRLPCRVHPTPCVKALYAAITRQNEAGTATYQPQEKITLPEAIYAYTQGSAFAEFRERIKGRLEPGYLADIVVLDRDGNRSGHDAAATPSHPRPAHYCSSGGNGFTRRKTKPGAP